MGRKRKTDKHLPSRVYFKHGAYFYIDSKNKWHKLDNNFQRAMAKWSANFAEQKPIIKMADLIDRYMSEIAPLKSKKSYQNNIWQIKPIRVMFSDLLPSSVTPVHVYQYMDSRAKVSKYSANREKELLSHIFSFAIRWGIVRDNPCKNVKSFSEKSRTRYVTDDEFKAVQSICSDFFKEIMNLAYLTGLRKGDLLNLNLSHLADDGIKIDTNKTGAKIIIEWTDELKKCINEIRSLRGILRTDLIVNKKGKKYTSSGFNAIWARIMKKALTQELITERFRFHDLRRKAATDAQKAGGREYARQLLGHTTQSITAKYINDYQKVLPLKSIKK